MIFLGSVALFAQDNLTYQRPPEEIASLVEAPLTPLVTFSPDKQWMILLERSDYPSIEQLSRPELRIAGMRLNPDNFGPSRGNNFIGVKAKKLSGGSELEIKNLPAEVQLGSPGFSPDSKKLAVLNYKANEIELWVIDMATLTASKISERKINNTMGGAYAWLSDSQHLIFTAVPTNLNPAGKIAGAHRANR